jgi:hypothetical protein
MAIKHGAQPHPETNPKFYTTGPSVPKDKKANTPLTPPPSVGAKPPAIVPKHPGRFDGVGGPPHQMGKPAVQAHGYGHSAPQRHGSLRLSGHGGSHRVGKK